MVLFKSLWELSRAKYVRISFLCGLLLFLGLLKLMVNSDNEIKLNYPTKLHSKMEEEYRKKFNLMMLDDGPEEIAGKECTLGN